MVSLTISEEVLKREGEELIDQLKNSLDEYEDLFRMRIFRILDLVDIEMEIFEDLYFDVRLVLKKYEIYQILKK